MRYIVLRLLAIAIIVSFFTGCGSGIPLTRSSSATPDLTGNWLFGADIPPAQAISFPIYALTGAINSQDVNVSAVFRALGICISPSQDIALTGSQSADGSVTLTSTNLPNNVATITLNFTTLYNFVSGHGTISISGSGPCAIPSTAFSGNEIQSVTGAYTGTISAASGFPSTATGTANLTQEVANSDGLFPVIGSITIAGASCTSTFSYTGLAAGPNISATLASTSGPSATGVVTGTINAGVIGPYLTLSINILSSGCNNGAFNATLNSQ